MSDTCGGGNTGSNERRRDDAAPRNERRDAPMNHYALATAMMPVLADTNAADILEKVKGLLTGGIGFLGAAMVVWGAVTIGINVHNGASGNGSAIASGVGVLVGGVIISAAAAYFGSLGTSWATGK